MSTIYKLRAITGHYDDGDYGAEHIGNESFGEPVIDDYSDYVVQWDVDGATIEITANADGDIVLPDGTIVATWTLANDDGFVYKAVIFERQPLLDNPVASIEFESKDTQHDASVGTRSASHFLTRWVRSFGVPGRRYFCRIYNDGGDVIALSAGEQWVGQ